MRKIVRYSVIIISVLILVLYLLKERSPFGGRNTSFAVKPELEISRIEFTSKNATVILEKKGEEWMVNKKFETRRSSILFILKILNEMEIKSPVNPDMFKKEIVDKDIDPVRVKIFERNRLIKSFLVYKTPSNTYGNIMKLRESAKPFIVYIPGNEVEIGSAFSLNELFWQPYTIFNLLPSDIQSVTFENPADTSSSFKIEKEDQRLSLYNPAREMTGWDTLRIRRYLSYFTHVPFETWAFELTDSEKQKIISEMPLYKLTVTTNAGKTSILILWERISDENGVKERDTDRLWAKMDNNDEIFIVRYIDIDPLIKRRSYFFPG